MGFWNLPNTFATLSGNQPASKLDTNFDALAIVPQYATAASGTNSIALTVPLPFSSYAVGMQFICVAPGTNTSSTVTLNVNSVGAVNVVKDSNNSLLPGDITAGSVVGFYYDGSNFHLMTNRANSISSGNVVINGDMRIDQRNTSVTALNLGTTRAFCVDRWFAGSSAAPVGTMFAARVSTLAGATGPAVAADVSPFALRIARTVGAYAGNIFAGQVVESVNMLHLAGQFVTLSFKIRCGTAYGGGAVTATLRTGTVTNESSTNFVAGTWIGISTVATVSVTPTTSFQTIFISTSVVLPLSAVELGVLFRTSNYTGSGSSNDTLDITDVQIEAGPAVTPFQRRSYAAEEVLCQRYTYLHQQGDTGRSASATATENSVKFPTTMRVSPTGSIQNSTNIVVRENTTGTSRTATTPAVVLNSSTSDGAYYTLSAASWSPGNFTTGNLTHLLCSAAGAGLLFESEI